MKKNRKKELRLIPGMKSGRCPYCGGHVVFRSADGIYKDNKEDTMLYVCSNYPACDAYVRVSPGTRSAIGSLADGRLRALRQEAHRHFDRLHQTGIMSRKEAYHWLAGMLQAPMSQTHIGYLGEYYCGRVIEESKKMLENRRRVHGGRAEYPIRPAVGGEFYATD